MFLTPEESVHGHLSIFYLFFLILRIYPPTRGGQNPIKPTRPEQAEF
jgi:hypothetical protein